MREPINGFTCLVYWTSLSYDSWLFELRFCFFDWLRASSCSIVLYLYSVVVLLNSPIWFGDFGEQLSQSVYRYMLQTAGFYGWLISWFAIIGLDLNLYGSLISLIFLASLNIFMSRMSHFWYALWTVLWLVSNFTATYLICLLCTNIS